jgi:hypothetical protein
MSEVTSIRVTIDPAKVIAQTQGPSSTTYQKVVQLANRILNNARGRCPVDTGYLRSTGHMESNPSGPTAQVIFDAKYARYVHDGTRFMAGRPFLTDALTEEMTRL